MIKLKQPISKIIELLEKKESSLYLKKYSINIWRPISEEIEWHDFAERGGTWSADLKRRVSIQLVPSEKYEDIKNFVGPDGITAIPSKAFIECNEKAGEIEVDAKNDLLNFRIYLTTKDYDEIFGEFKQLRRWQDELSEKIGEEIHISDQMIENCKFLKLLEDPRIDQENLNKWLTMPHM